jgi:tetratricopeptide (TPR) repeat protein
MRQLLCTIGLLSLLVYPAMASKPEWRLEAERSLARASANLAADTNSATAGWEFARACFDLAEYATNSTERAALAQQGIAAARRVIARHPDNGPAHYYLGMNLGQLARTRLLSALKMVKELEKEFLHALELAPNLDFAGPDRGLGLLYRDAPSIGSVGSRRKAQHHLQNAVRLAPLYPENRLLLAESYFSWGDRKRRHAGV